MIHLIPIEPINDAHGALIVGAFNRLFVKDGGYADGYGDGSNGRGDSWGAGDGYGYGYDYGGQHSWVGVIPEEWRVK